MDNEVSEATAALKGLLGIGIASPKKPTEAAPPEEKPKDEAPTKGKTKTKSQKKKRNKQKPKQGDGKPAGNGEKKEQTKKAGGKSQGTKKAENYAWSAFQSSPDASKLPIPAFDASSPTDEKPSASAKLFSDSNDDPTSADKVEAIENGVVEVSEAKAQNVEASNAQATSEQEAPPTGVNLASLAGPPAGRNNVQSAQVPPQNLAHSHGNHAAYQYFGPPQGYMTIQVQVPMTLLPGRAMYVMAPTGQTLQVVVPPGVPPGAVIPVQVPMPTSTMAHPGFHPHMQPRSVPGPPQAFQ